MEELQHTLFALSETDLKKLGFKNTDKLIEDLKIINERISEVKWQFENNTYDDESFLSNDPSIEGYMRKTGEFGPIVREFKEEFDDAGISVQRLIDNISNLDLSKIAASEEASNITATMVAKEKEVNIEQELIEKKKEEKATEKEVADVSKTATEQQTSAYRSALEQIDKYTERMNYLHDLIEETPPQYAIETYDNKRNKYAKLSDDELNAKAFEKSQEALNSNTTKLKRQLSSLLALIDEFKARGKELSLQEIVPQDADLNAIDNIVKSFRNYFDLLNDDSNTDYISVWKNELEQISKENEKLKKSLKGLADQNPLDKLVYHLKELANGETSLRINEVYDPIIKTMNEIYKITGEQPKVEDYTNKANIIKGVNEQLKRMALLKDEDYQATRRAEFAEKQRAKATQETSNAIKDEVVAVKEETAVVDQNTNVQSNNAVVKNTTTLPNSIKAGFKDESGVVQGVVTAENTSLESLKEKIFEVRDAIQAKIDKFEEERTSVDAVVSSERKELDLLRDKLAEIKGYIEQLYSRLGNLGKIDFNGKVKVEGLSTLLSSLKDDKLDTKLTAMYTYLDDFAKAVNQIDFKNNFTDQLNNILSKGEELKNLASILKKTNKAGIENVGKAVNQKDTAALKAYNNAYKLLINTEERFQELTNKKNSGLLSANEAKELSKITSDRKQAELDIQQIIKNTSGAIKQESNAEAEHLAYANKITKALQEAADAQAKLDAANNRKTLTNNLQKEIDALSKIELAPKFTQEFNGKITEEISKAKSALQGTDAEIEEMTGHLKEFRNSIPKNALESSYTALDAYALDISKTLTNNSKMSRKLKNELNALYDTVIRYRKTGLFDDKDLLNVKNRIIEIKDEILRTEQNGRSMIDKIGMQIRHISSQQIARYFSFYDIIRYIRQIGTEVTKLDTALTELRKVSDASSERLQQSLSKSTETAKELGSTIEDVINITADWSRLGYSVDEAEELARVTTLFKNVGDNMSAEDASSFMISTLKGFEMEADQAMDIADKFNEVANNFAIDTAGIGDALQRSAASFNAANTDLNESIALITATNAVVQNPESVGTLWKTVSARIRGAKAELEDMGEDTEGMVETTSKLRDLVKGMTGFDIMEDEETFKSIYDIVLGIGEKWQELNDIDKAALLEALAGKRGGNALAAALNNIDDLKASYEMALNASGSAMKEQENYERSIQYSIDRLKATAQDLAQDFMSSDFIKGAIDALNGILELIDKLIEHTGSLIPLVTALGSAYASIKIGQGVGGAFDAIGGLLGKEKSAKSFSLKGIGELLKTPVNELFKETAKEGVEVVAETIVENSDTVVSAVTETLGETAEVITKSAAPAAAAGEEMAASITGVGEAAAGAGASLGVCLGVFLAVVAAVGIGIAVFNHFNVTVKEVKEEIDEAQSKVSSLSNEIKELETLENKTTAQENRLKLLRKELAVQNQILESKKALLKLEQTGTKATDRFDEDNYNTIAAIETGNLIESDSLWSNLWGHFFAGYKDAFNETAEDALGNLNLDTSTYHKFKEEFEAIDKEVNSEAFRYYDDSRKNQLLNSRERALENLQKSEESLSDSSIIAEAKAAELEETLLQMEKEGISTNSKAYR